MMTGIGGHPLSLLSLDLKPSMLATYRSSIWRNANWRHV